MDTTTSSTFYGPAPSFADSRLSEVRCTFSGVTSGARRKAY